MKLYLVSLAVGLGVGLIYGLLNVRSPAPPVIALIGLLGMLIGEQIVPLVRAAVHRAPEPTVTSDHPARAADNRAGGRRVSPPTRLG
jgi:XapX domain-containing protein